MGYKLRCEILSVMSDVVLRHGLQPCERSRTNGLWSLNNVIFKQPGLIVTLGEKRIYSVLYEVLEFDNVAKSDLTPFVLLPRNFVTISVNVRLLYRN